MIRELEDKPYLQGARNRLVEQLKKEGITDKNVLGTIQNVPRHFFIDISYLSHAYKNRPLPIDCDQTISQPYTVAFQTQLLNITSGLKVLEIGTGSGYQATILGYMGAIVYTIERQQSLHEQTKALFEAPEFTQYFGNQLKIKLLFGDGYKGLPEQAPFDRILITAAIPEIPQTLFNQLSDKNGILVAPEGKGNSQIMKRYTKNNSDIQIETFGMFSFVPMLPGTEESNT